MRIKRKFVKLTKQTVPFGTEKSLESQLPKGYQKDIHGNYFISIGDNYSTMFTCHLDTACKTVVKVNHVFDKNFIKTDGTSILGADDKAGMVVLLYMIEKKVPGLYYFFIGEEVGCVGSELLSLDFKQENIKKVVSFDRRGTHSIITHQIYGRCCSNEFANALAKAYSEVDESLKLEPDDTGILTDSVQFIDLVPECTNISVGYYSEHTVNERQDIEYLTRLCKASAKVDWESLPIVRGSEDYIDLDDLDLDLYFDLYNLEEEKSIITEFLKKHDYTPVDVHWDGEECYCDNGDGNYTYIGGREELSLFIDEL